MFYSKYINLLLGLSFTSLVGCASVTVESNGTQFPGIHPAISNKNTDVILVHGMCRKDSTWFEEHVTELSSAIAGSQVKYIGLADNIITDDDLQVYHATVLTDSGSLNLYGIVYSNISEQQKTELKNAKVSGKQAWANRKIKNFSLNDCLADVVVYNGPSGKSIRSGVRSVLSQLNEDSDRDDAVVLLSESLGSKIVRDSLLCDHDEEGVVALAKNGLSLLRRGEVFIMYANQIPFLDLASHESCNVEPSANTFAAFMDSETGRGDFSDILGLLSNDSFFESQGLIQEDAVENRYWIAYSDPNDILSYRLDIDKYTDDGIEVTNVTVKNTRNWFGLFANPLKAHSGYRSNHTVKSMVLMGCLIDGNTCEVRSIQK